MSVCYIALLRGVNVGTAHRIGMRGLAAEVEEPRFSDGKTHINSGNAWFEAETASAPEIDIRTTVRNGNTTQRLAKGP